MLFPGLHYASLTCPRDVPLWIRLTMKGLNKNKSSHVCVQSQGVTGFRVPITVFTGLQGVSLRCPFQTRIDLES